MQLPTFLKDPATALIGERCYNVLVEKFDYTNVDCLKYSLSKGIGAGCVVGGMIVKVPQIFKIISASSAKGLSIPSYLMECFASMVVLAYNYRNDNPFSTYGETFFISIQNLIILALMYTYSNRLGGLAFVGAVLGIFTYAVFTPALITAPALALLQSATIPVFLGSRVPQIIENYQSGSTGQLSAFAVFNYLLGGVMRIFTTLQEVDDQIILLGFVLGVVFNGIIAGQMVYYWNASPSKKAKKSKSKKQ